MKEIILIKLDCGMHSGFKAGECSKCKNQKYYGTNPHFAGRVLGETIEEFRLHERQRKGWN